MVGLTVILVIYTDSNSLICQQKLHNWFAKFCLQWKHCDLTLMFVKSFIWLCCHHHRHRLLFILSFDSFPQMAVCISKLSPSLLQAIKVLASRRISIWKLQFLFDPPKEKNKTKSWYTFTFCLKTKIYIYGVFWKQKC